MAGGFTSRGAGFNNSFSDFGGGFTAWEGWAYSNATDATTPGPGNQYSALAGGGAGGSANYGVAFTNTFVLDAPIVTLPVGTIPLSLRATNTTYTGLSMRDGDAFAKKFGGSSGDDPDWFLLTITGLDAVNQPVGSVEFYLADYRFSDNAQDYILDDWTNASLASLAGAVKLSFALASSDVGTFGMNTPAYFALDSLSVTRLPGDVNDDNVVDIFDVNFVSSQWGGDGPLADANGDGVVDIFDVNVISAHWGESVPGGLVGAAQQVPEPAAIALLLLGLAPLLASRRRAHKPKRQRGSVARPEGRRAWLADVPRPSFLRACHPADGF